MRVKDVKNGTYLWNAFAKEILSKKKKNRLESLNEIASEYLLLEMLAEGKTEKEAKEKVEKLTGTKVTKTSYRAVGVKKVNLKEPKRGIAIGEVLPNCPKAIKEKKISESLAKEIRKVFRRKKRRIPKRLEKVILKGLLSEERRKIAYGKNRRLSKVIEFASKFAKKRIKREIPRELIRKEVYRLRKKSRELLREEMRLEGNDYVIS